MNAGGASMTYRLMDEKDIERIMRWPFTAIASDGGVTEPGVGNPHPRSYGTNARVLGEYVRVRGGLSLEDVNGKVVVDEGKVTGARPGQALRRQ
jgi:N-acyl-D-amino-acid deacylase